MPKFLEVEEENMKKKSWIKAPRIPLKDENPSQSSSQADIVVALMALRIYIVFLLSTKSYLKHLNH